MNSWSCVTPRYSSAGSTPNISIPPRSRAELRRLKRRHHLVRHGDRSLSAGRAPLPNHSSDSGSFRRRARLRFGHHYQVRSCARATPSCWRGSQTETIRVHLTVTTLDERLARLLEPRAPRPALRLAAVEADRSRSSGQRPGPSGDAADQRQRGEPGRRVRRSRSKWGVFLQRGASLLEALPARVFLPFLEERFPHLVRRYRERFEKAAYLKGHYPEMIAERVQKIRSRHKMTDRRAPEWPVREQMDFSHFTTQSESTIILYGYCP